MALSLKAKIPNRQIFGDSLKAGSGSLRVVGAGSHQLAGGLHE